MQVIMEFVLVHKRTIRYQVLADMMRYVIDE